MMQSMPATWRMVKLGTCLQRRKDTVMPATLSDTTVGLVGLEDIQDEGRGEITIRQTPPQEIESLKTRFVAGDILYGKLRPYLNKVGIAPQSGLCSTEIWAFGPSALVDPKYAAFFLASSFFVDRVSSLIKGANLPRVGTEAFDSIEIPLPPLSEQLRIVEILQEAEEIRRLRAQGESKIAELMPAMFHFAFSNLVTKDGTKMHRLDEIAYVQGGIQVSKARDNSPLKVPYLRVANVQRDSLDLQEMKEIGLTEAELERTRLQKDDILIVEGHGNASELGRAAIWTGEIDPCTHQNHLIRVRCKPGTDPAYVLSMLNSPLGRGHFLRTGKTTSGLNTISTGIVRNFRMPVPTVKAMENFAALREATLPLMSDAVKNSNLAARNLNVSLSAYAFSGQLTADWRETNIGRLAIEARERDEALHQSQKRTVLLIANAGSTTKAFAAHIFQARADGIYSDLNREQHFLLKEIDRMFAGVDYGRYFTAEKIADEVEGPLHRNPQGVLAHLQVFAARGLLIPVSRRRKDAAGGPFAGCYRLPLKASEGQSFSGVEDIELPEQPGDDVRGELMKIQRRLATGVF